MEEAEEDLLNVPLTKPLFKKKKPINKSSTRKQRSADGIEDQPDSQGLAAPSPIATKRKAKPRQTFVRGNNTAKADIQRWTRPTPSEEHVTNEFPGVAADNLADGAILTAEDLESDTEQDAVQDTKKYVPQLDEKIHRKINKAGHVDEFAHEYDDMDDYDTIHDNHAISKPESEPEEHLSIDEDDDVADPDTEVNQAKTNLWQKYDTHIGDSDDDSEGERIYKTTGIVKIVEPLTMEQELARLTELVNSLKLENTNIESQISANKASLEKLDERRSEVLKSLDDL